MNGDVYGSRILIATPTSLSHVRAIYYTYRYVQTLLIAPFDPATVNCRIIIEMYNYTLTNNIIANTRTRARARVSNVYGVSSTLLQSTNYPTNWI